MPSLKDLKLRIRSIRSTRKITSAMKLVAASKLKRAQEQAEAGRPYAERMARMLASLAEGVSDSSAHPLIAGHGRNDRVLIVLITADRGLAGGFNTNSTRLARRMIRDLQGEGKTVKVIAVGRKGSDLLRRDHRDTLLQTINDFARPRVEFATARALMEKITELFELDEIDSAHVVYNEFVNVITQRPVSRQILPLSLETGGDGASDPAPAAAAGPRVMYEFEPSEDEILARLLPLNLSIQLYSAMMESAAGEQAARMTAMDNATRNAGDMIKRLNLQYNRSRQAAITKELIEIISGAEAV